MSSQTRRRLGQGAITLGVLSALLPLGLLVYGIIVVAPHAQEPTSGMDLSYGFASFFLLIMVPIAIIGALLFITTLLPWRWVHWPGGVIYFMYTSFMTVAYILIPAGDQFTLQTLLLLAALGLTVILSAFGGPVGWLLIRRANPTAAETSAEPPPETPASPDSNPEKED